MASSHNFYNSTKEIGIFFRNFLVLPQRRTVRIVLSANVSTFRDYIEFCTMASLFICLLQ